MENLTLSDVSESETLSALTATLTGDVGAPPSIHHDFGWIKANVKNKNARLLAILGESHGKLLWYLPLTAYPYTIRVSVGPVVLWAARVTRVDGRNLRTAESADATLTEQRIVQAFKVIRRELSADTVIFLASIPEDSPEKRAFSMLASTPNGYRALRYGPTYMHRTADIGGGLDEYLKRLGSKTRADLRRTRRRFEQAAGADTELFVAQTENDLERLVDAVMDVAPKTWQYQQEKAGPGDRDLLFSKCREATHKSMLRSYVLYVNDQPIAFQIGYLANGVFDAHEIGYDPAWRKTQPGIVLHMSIVEDLGISAPHVVSFDFGITDRLHKSRLCTEAVEEGFYYLFPNSARGRLLYWALHTTMVLTDWLKAMRERFLRSNNASPGT